MVSDEVFDSVLPATSAVGSMCCTKLPHSWTPYFCETAKTFMYLWMLFPWLWQHNLNVRQIFLLRTKGKTITSDLPTSYKFGSCHYIGFEFYISYNRTNSIESCFKLSLFLKYLRLRVFWNFILVKLACLCTPCSIDTMGSDPHLLCIFKWYIVKVLSIEIETIFM